MSTFDVLYKRLTKTLVELRDKHGMDPERIALQAAKSAERSNRTAGRRTAGRRNRAGPSMKVTAILRRLSNSYIEKLEAMSPRDAFDEVLRARRDLDIDIKIGDGSIRDTVEFNMNIRSLPVSMKIEPRKGYRLATFMFG